MAIVSTKLTIPEGNYSIIGLYRAAVRELGYIENVDEVVFDCRKINIAANLQEGLYAYYKAEALNIEPNISEEQLTTEITMLLAFSGPKVDTALPNNTVEVFDGFVCK